MTRRASRQAIYRLWLIGLALLCGCAAKRTATPAMEPGMYLIVSVGEDGRQVWDVNTALIAEIAALQSGLYAMCAGKGSSKAQDCAMMPALGAYTNGMVITYCPGSTNTASGQTINIDTLGPVNILRNNGAMLQQDDLYAGRCYQLMYQALDKTFRMLAK